MAIMEDSTSARPIERLVRQKQTGLFFKSPSEWTPDRSAARHFEDLLSVFEVCYDYSLQGVQLILKDLMADFEIALDLDTP